MPERGIWDLLEVDENTFSFIKVTSEMQGHDVNFSVCRCGPFLKKLCSVINLT